LTFENKNLPVHQSQVLVGAGLIAIIFFLQVF